MYRVVILSVVFVTVLAVFSKEDCRDYGDDLMFCCKNPYPDSRFPIRDDFSECDSMDPMSCEHGLCVAKKMGLTTEDGKLDKAKLVDVGYTKVADDPSLMEDVKSKCINGDIDMYAPAKSCDYLKLNRCVTMQWLKRCSDWDDSSECQQFKGYIHECANLLL